MSDTTNQEQMAVTVRDAVQAVDTLPVPAIPAPAPNRTTPEQAKVEAVANLTFKAYERASMVQLTAEEVTALQKDFPDEAFKPGAAGKENLIYIEHAYLRDRLSEVLGVGQWALIPRNRWVEDFRFMNKWNKIVEGKRVYVEAMLLVRGCFVAEAVGDMDYFPNNQSQTYGDAVEGAKTAALRRCCKEFSVGLQAWKKDWCEGWWQRKNATGRQQAPTQPTSQPRPKPAAPPTPPGVEFDPEQRRGEQPKPATIDVSGQSQSVYPVVSVVGVKEVQSKPGAPKPWTAYFCKFDDGVGELEAATFDKKIADLAIELEATGEQAALTVRPGRKPNTREIVSLSRQDQPPTDNEPPTEQEPDNEPEPF